ncbi:MAG: dihydroneopterin aldolase [Cyclobacteriaceae bacterium]|jgi:dihydroneopterin aldolase
MGKVSLEGMEFYARHGYYEEERIIGNKYSVDVTVELDFSNAADSDKLQGTVNYEKIYEIVSGVMAIDAMLLEHLAGKIIQQLKTAFPQIKKSWVKVSKYNPPIKGLCHRAVVELEG